MITPPGSRHFLHFVYFIGPVVYPYNRVYTLASAERRVFPAEISRISGSGQYYFNYYRCGRFIIKTIKKYQVPGILTGNVLI